MRLYMMKKVINKTKIYCMLMMTQMFLKILMEAITKLNCIKEFFDLFTIKLKFKKMFVFII